MPGSQMEASGAFEFSTTVSAFHKDQHLPPAQQTPWTSEHKGFPDGGRQKYKEQNTRSLSVWILFCSRQIYQLVILRYFICNLRSCSRSQNFQHLITMDSTLWYGTKFNKIAGLINPFLNAIGNYNTLGKWNEFWPWTFSLIQETFSGAKKS